MSTELDKSLTSVAKAAGIGFAGAVAGSALGMMNQVILGRFMGPQQYGLFNLALGVVMIANTLAIFGLYGAIGRFIPYHLNRGESDKVKSTIDFGSTFVVASGAVFAFMVFMFAGVISNQFFHEPGLERPLKLFALGTPLLALQQVVRGVIRGFKAVKQEALLFNIGDRVIKIVFFLASLAVVRTVYGAIAAFLIGALVTIIIAFWMVRRRLFTAYRATAKAPIARELLSFSWPLALTGFTFLFISQTDKVLLGHFLAAEDVGIYSPVLVVAGMLAFVSTPFEYIFLPIVSEYLARRDISGLGELYKTTSKWMFLIVLPIFSLILIFAREVITFLFGIEYVGGYLALIIVSFGITASDTAGNAGNILVGCGNTRLNLAAEILAAVANVILNVILIPRYGIVGAAIATAISYVARTGASLSFVYFLHRIHPYRWTYVGFLSSALLVSGAVYALKLLLPLPYAVTMFLLGVFFILAYFVLAGLFRSFDESDRLVVDALERRLGINLALLKRFI